MFSSLRPKIGKTFHDQNLEARKRQILLDCRSMLLPISIAEVENDLTKNKEDFSTLFQSIQQNVGQRDYLDLQKFAIKEELQHLKTIRKQQDRKITVALKNDPGKLIKFQKGDEEPLPKTECKVRHKELEKQHATIKNKKKREKKKENKLDKVKEDIENIKSGNLVHNLSDFDIPDDAYLFLSLGSSFIPSKVGKKHDDIFDTKAFSRNLRWKGFHHQIRNDDTIDPTVESVEDCVLNTKIEAPRRLKPKGSDQPLYHDKRLEEIIEELQKRVVDIEKKQPVSNLTHREVKGLQWCRNMVAQKKIYITKVDKGGSILILNASTVEQTMLETLENPDKFEKLDADPRPQIRLEIIEMIEKYVENSVLSVQDRLYITGVTERLDYSHDPAFQVSAPYMYP